MNKYLQLAWYINTLYSLNLFFSEVPFLGLEAIEAGLQLFKK